MSGFDAGCSVSSMIELMPAPSEGARFTDNVSEVIIKTMAHQVVARDRNVAAPRGPNAV